MGSETNNVELGEGGEKTETSSKEAIHQLRKKLIPSLRYSLLVSLAIYLAMFIIGCKAVHHCPINEDIPLFCILTGFVGLFSKLITYLRDRIIKRNIKIKYVESALYSIELVTFFLGTYWVYKAYKPNFEDHFDHFYCDKTAYMFAFVYITFVYALVLFVIIGLIFLAVCCCFCAAKIWGQMKNLVETEEKEEDVSPRGNEQETSPLDSADEATKVPAETKTPPDPKKSLELKTTDPKAIEIKLPESSEKTTVEVTVLQEPQTTEIKVLQEPQTKELKLESKIREKK